MPVDINKFDQSPFTIRWESDRKYSVLYKNTPHAKGEGSPKMAQSILDVANQAYKLGLTDRLIVRFEEI